MRVLGLDLSLTSTGVALPDGSSRTLSPNVRGVERLAWFRAELSRITNPIAQIIVDVVTIEGYSLGTSRQSSHAHGLGELGGTIRLTLWDYGIPFVDVPPASVKTFATGKGNANKNDMLLAAAKRLGYDGNSNDEADALWLRAMTMHAYGDPVVDVPLSHVRALEKVAWPVVHGFQRAVA